LCLATVPGLGAAYETDQWSNRNEPLRDATEVLNKRVNDTIRDIADDWTGPRNEARFVDRVYHRLGGIYWVDKIEKWAMESPQVDRLSTPRHESVYAAPPIWATRVAAFFGIGPTIKVNGVLIGSDKLGHFMSQGRKFWLRYRNYDDVERAATASAFTERAIFGQLTTGVYSNADLVANYEGYRFYRSLFDDDVITGKPSILIWTGTGWKVQRAFDFADHVNEYWDEAINVNHFDALLYPYMKKRLLEDCDIYWERPHSFDIPDEAELKRRYHELQLRDTSELRLSNLCPNEDHSKGASSLAGG